MTTFGERLRRLRQEAGLSQGDLAGEDLSASYISLLESGKRTPSDDVARLLAERLGCSASRLLADQPSERERRIELELAYGRLAIEHGEAGAATERLRTLLDEGGLSERATDDVAHLLGLAYERQGDLRSAATVLLPLFDRCRAGRSHLPLCAVTVALCACYLDAGDNHQAVVVGELGLQAARDRKLDGTEEYFRLAATTMYAYVGLGDFLHATTWAEQLAAEAEAAGERGGQAALYWNSAIVAELEGRVDEALHLCERALAHLSELGDTRDYARLKLASAGVLLSCDPPRTGPARAALEACQDQLTSYGSRVDQGEWHTVMAGVLIRTGEPEAAVEHARTAVNLLSEGAPTELCRAYLVLSDCLTVLGDDTEADLHRLQAVAQLDRASTGRVSAGEWRDVGERLALLGHPERAVEALRRGLDAAGVRDRTGSGLRELLRAAVPSTATRD